MTADLQTKPGGTKHGGRALLRDFGAREQAGGAAGAGDERFRRLLEATDVIPWEADAESWRFTYVGPQAARVLGYPVPEWYAADFWTAHLHPDDRAYAIDLCLRSSQKGADYDFEYRMLAADGRVVWLHDFVAVEMRDGRPKSLRGFLIDVSDQKQVEARLRESETRFRSMADSTPVLIWMSGTDKQCIYFNQPWLGFTGRTLEEEVGDGWAEGVHPDDLARCLEVYATHFGAREPFEMEYRLRRHDGEYRWVLDRGQPRFTQAGEFEGYVGSAIDITDRKRAELKLQQALAEINELKERLQQENVYLRQEVRLRHEHAQIIGQGPAITRVLAQAEQVAGTDATVLLLGETGTGKELLAAAIHDLSPRRDRPMVKVNCAALPATLVESELFGREKGAYTGALTKQIGRFELAHGSTIFLDEVGDLPPEVQVKLLRVLQEGTLEHLGSPKPIQVNVRVVAASNRDLAQAVRAGKFREDLFYRLNVFPITVPPLRERRQDVPLLVWTFVEEFAKTLGKNVRAVAKESMEALQRYPWPGNVRELRNIIERAMICSTGPTLRVALPELADAAAARSMALEDVERAHLLHVLELSGWRVRGQYGAAELLRLKPTTLEARMAKLGIARPGKSSNGS